MAANATAASDWRALLDVAVAEHPKGKAGVAARLGFSRAYVSRVFATGRTSAGFPNGVPQRFIDRVIDRLGEIKCPATYQKESPAFCRRVNQVTPTHNPLLMRVWRECQQCPHKPEATQEPA